LESRHGELEGDKTNLTKAYIAPASVASMKLDSYGTIIEIAAEFMKLREWLNFAYRPGPGGVGHRSRTTEVLNFDSG